MNGEHPYLKLLMSLIPGSLCVDAYARVFAPEVTVAGALAAAADDRCTNTGSSTDLLYRYSRSSNTNDMKDAEITSFGPRNYCKIEIAPGGIIYYHVPRYPFNINT